MSTTDRLQESLQVARAVSSAHQNEISRFRNWVQRAIIAGFRSEDRIAGPDRLRGPSVVDRSTVVSVRHSFSPTGRDLASPTLISPRFFRIEVRGSISPGLNPGSSAPTVAYSEAEGWLRAALGPRWADYAYHLVSRSPANCYEPASSVRFAVIIDSAGSPLLAPTDFEWPKFTGQDDVVVRKIDPHPQNRVLIANLIRNGPFDVPSGKQARGIVRDKQIDLIVGMNRPEPSSIPAFRALVSALRTPARVDSRFLPLAATLNGTTGLVEFRREGHVQVFHEAFPVPTYEHLTTVPSSSESWTALYGFPSMSIPATPCTWAAGLCAYWREGVAYGGLGSPVGRKPS